MSLILLSPPASEPVTLAELKQHLRVTHTDEDALITGVLVAAVRAVEARGGLACMPQQWRLTLDAPPMETLHLPIAPVASIDAITVTDGEGAPQPVDASVYEFASGSPGRLRPAGPWPQPAPKIDGVRIDFTAGYADAGAVPEPLKQAVKILAGYFYETREAAHETRVYTVPQSVDALLAPYREFRL
ncbi:head-tail connector protein [Hyphococcus flavus]|uniref:Head-tail connector protein n=1 Tax=Hyphococcus flavus TaxID=1866326 RepID=A0AAF0CF44_9PROT|nr:head-tail connector protein [Hyphococcus flavus]WDI32156.1 head-tail connector protein [Hyphococcus flavus]